ncbi:hypothetical protein Scep_001036 [Stephania cephalantha]|uniref:F-box domain-containing protein n=1 Tax=Stephania cephalantha TaxID=152367 RepID=A0AAP0L8A6_9MAGN
MKRGVDADEEESSGIADDKVLKRRKGDADADADGDGEEVVAWSSLGPDLLYEVLKHADGRTLGVASCVNKQWNKTAQDERLWETICTSHYAKSRSTTSGMIQQLRSVVLPLGGFRRLYSLHLLNLLKPSSSPTPSSSNISSSLSSFAASSSSSSAIPRRPSKVPIHWGKDELHLSLSLLSIRFYETMCPNDVKKL